MLILGAQSSFSSSSLSLSPSAASAEKNYDSDEGEQAEGETVVLAGACRRIFLVALLPLQSTGEQWQFGGTRFLRVCNVAIGQPVWWLGSLVDANATAPNQPFDLE